MNGVPEGRMPLYLASFSKERVPCKTMRRYKVGFDAQNMASGVGYQNLIVNLVSSQALISNVIVCFNLHRLHFTTTLLGHENFKCTTTILRY